MPPTAIIDDDHEKGSTIYYALEQSAVWRLDNPATGSGVWTQVMTAAALGAFGLVSAKFNRIRVQGGRVNVLVTEGSSPFNLWILQSTTGGISWLTPRLVSSAAISVKPYTYQMQSITVHRDPTYLTFTKPASDAVPYGIVERRWGDNASFEASFGLAYYTGDVYWPPSPVEAYINRFQSGAATSSKDHWHVFFNGSIGNTNTIKAIVDGWVTAEYGAEGLATWQWGSPAQGSTMSSAAESVRLGVKVDSQDRGEHSFDMGVYWNVPEPVVPLGFDVAPANNNWMYIGLETSIIWSSDGGYTWQTLTSSYGADDIRVNPLLAGVFAFYAPGGTLYQSINGAVQTLLAGSVRVKRPRRIAYNGSGGEIFVLHPTAADTFSAKKRALAAWSDLETGIAGARCLRVYQKAGGSYVMFCTGTNIRFSANSGATFADRKGDWAGYGSPVGIHLL